eukprot:CAMPEP_0172327370 /NCGR_PEP_ID=MMETSP1058-20130122/59370_1 /TAXON_ID=83371 /ORGANISM="Detonula confervacea, Strain CCMP 353" /LENGTH=686 /DNA_ID=CAMNT_0013044401 /DNA_START=439 /DNA_END=2499 /DNA_ORIENTATION=+
MAPFAHPRSDSPPASQKYSTLLDVVLDHVCCAADTNNNSTHRGSERHRRNREQQQQHSLLNQRASPRSQSGNLYQLNNDQTKGQLAGDSHWQNLPESIILPHLRFNPLPSSTSCSSLQDFFALFLADDAPDSFLYFHESNGDENVHVTPWKNVNNNKNNMAENRMERLITFHTKITPGSSSNPLSQSENTNHGSTNTIPLGVTITQSLIQHVKTWVLECEFSFDFYSPTPSSIVSTNSGVGKKLGTGLGQYLMSHVVKGSTVNVVVTLSECDETDRNFPTMMKRSGSYGNAIVASMPPRCHDGFLSCFSHPLLLPPEGLCSAGAYNSTKNRGRRKSKSKNNKLSVNVEEPSQIGASLLSAIKAKNAPSDAEFGTEGPISDASLAKTPLVNNRFAGLSSSIPNMNQRPKSNGRPQDDVLSCTSRGSLKMKHIPSFELSRAPSTVSMRHMILEKHGSTITPSSSNSPLNVRRTSSADAVPPPSSSSSSSPQGLSMRIEMELGSTNPQPAASTASSLSSFSRSASISTIDDKVRRGLKKRVARTWISWAESWCMRLWEEEEADRAARRALGLAMPDSNKRSKVNVRPIVRRIGQPIVKKKEKDSLSKSSKKSKIPKNVWKPMQAEKNSNGRSTRWMSLEQDGEFGVEVACATPRLSPLAICTDALKSQGATKQSMKRRLFKGLSASDRT